MRLAKTLKLLLSIGGDPVILAQLEDAIDNCNDTNELDELLELLLKATAGKDTPLAQKVRRRLARLKLLTVESVLDRIDAIEKKAQADDVASKPDDGLDGPR